MVAAVKIIITAGSKQHKTLLAQHLEWFFEGSGGWWTGDREDMEQVVKAFVKFQKSLRA